ALHLADGPQRALIHEQLAHFPDILRGDTLMRHDFGADLGVQDAGRGQERFAERAHTGAAWFENDDSDRGGGFEIVGDHIKEAFLGGVELEGDDPQVGGADRQAFHETAVGLGSRHRRPWAWESRVSSHAGVIRAARRLVKSGGALRSRGALRVWRGARSLRGAPEKRRSSFTGGSASPALFLCGGLFTSGAPW